MLKLEDLDGIKLVNADYFATDIEAELAVEQAISQGSQAWGVRRDVGVLLKLARDLKIALALAATADQNGRMLKGAQLEGGRLKKQIEKLNAENVELAGERDSVRASWATTARELTAAGEEIAELTATIAEERAEISGLSEERDGVQRDLDAAKLTVQTLVDAHAEVDGS